MWQLVTLRSFLQQVATATSRTAAVTEQRTNLGVVEPATTIGRRDTTPSRQRRRPLPVRRQRQLPVGVEAQKDITGHRGPQLQRLTLPPIQPWAEVSLVSFFFLVPRPRGQS